ncbi:hypothetical protein SDC9_19986 [bioreactor metagenome]|uniref:Uncharacterized protein n=1 Tax=bioreactor metagenome TaxID=1076179 RepID=A0A644U5I3_9ZZZZ
MRRRDQPQGSASSARQAQSRAGAARRRGSARLRGCRHLRRELAPQRLADLGGLPALRLDLGRGHQPRHLGGPALIIDRDHGEIAAVGVPPRAAGDVLGLDPDADLHRTAPGMVHRGTEEDQLAHMDRFLEGHLIDAQRHRIAPRIARGEREGDPVEPVQQRPAMHLAGEIRHVRRHQHRHLEHFSLVVGQGLAHRHLRFGPACPGARKGQSPCPAHGSLREVAQPLGHVGAHRKAQPGLVARPQCGEDQPVVARRLVALDPAVKRAHGGAELQPDGLDHRQHRRCLRAQIEGAVELEIGADVGDGIVLGDRLGIRGVDRAEPVDQREVGARQGAGGKFRLDQRAQRGKLLDALVRKLRRRHPARGGEHQRPFCNQPAQRLAHRGHRDVELFGQPAQGQRLAGGQFAMHDLQPQRAVDPVMRGGLDRTGGDRGHGAYVITNPPRVNAVPSVAEADRLQRAALALQPGAVRGVVGHQPRHLGPEGGRVVHLREMRHLMCRDIVEHRRRRHDQPPGIGERAVGRAGAPARAGVAQGDAAEGSAQHRGVALGRGLQAQPRAMAQEGLEPRRQPILARRHDQPPGFEPRRAHRPGLDPPLLALHRQGGAETGAAQRGHRGKGAAQPLAMALREGHRLGKRRTHGQRQHHLPIESRHPQAEPPRPGRAAQRDGNAGQVRQGETA